MSISKMAPLIIWTTNGGNFFHVDMAPFDEVIKAAARNPVRKKGKVNNSYLTFSNMKQLSKFLNEHFKNLGQNAGTPK